MISEKTFKNMNTKIKVPLSIHLERNKTMNENNDLFKDSKQKLFKMIDDGLKSKVSFVADSNFWKEFKKI